MKKMGRRHRPFFRICAVDGRAPRDGRVIEELGTYDPMISDTDARATLNNDRIDYWIGVGAQPSDKVSVLIKKYGTNGTHLDVQSSAKEMLSAPKSLPDLGAPTFIVEPPQEESPEPATETSEAAAAEAPAAETPADESATPPVEEVAEAPSEETAETPGDDAAPTEEAAADEPATEESATEEEEKSE
jgi:small subunit ribosomal protein S16